MPINSRLDAIYIVTIFQNDEPRIWTPTWAKNNHFSDLIWTSFRIELIKQYKTNLNEESRAPHVDQFFHLEFQYIPRLSKTILEEFQDNFDQ